MGIIIEWIALGMAAALLANVLLLGKRSRRVIFICLACFTGDQALSETDAINLDVRKIPDLTTVEWAWR